MSIQQSHDGHTDHTGWSLMNTSTKAPSHTRWKVANTQYTYTVVAPHRLPCPAPSVPLKHAF